MFKKESSAKKILTPKLAEQYLSLNTFERQRQLRRSHVLMLLSRIDAGLFLTGNIGIANVAVENETISYLVNGQHQCNAVLAANKNIDVVVEKYSCENMRDVSLLYQQYDNHASRSLANLVTFHASAIGIDWPPRIANLIVSGAALREGWGKKLGKQEKVEMLERYMEQGNFIKKLLTETPDKKPGAETKHLRKSPVICAILLTWEKCQRDTKEFWENVRDGEGLTRKSPQFKLREFLRDTNFSAGAWAGVTTKKPATQHEIVFRSIVAWNAYRKNISTALKYYVSKQIPRVL